MMLTQPSFDANTNSDINAFIHTLSLSTIPPETSSYMQLPVDSKLHEIRCICIHLTTNNYSDYLHLYSSTHSNYFVQHGQTSGYTRA